VSRALKRGFAVAFNVRAEARTYLRNNDNGEKQIPCGDDNKKDKGNSNSNDNGNSNSNSNRLPSPRFRVAPLVESSFSDRLRRGLFHRTFAFVDAVEVVLKVQAAEKQRPEFGQSQINWLNLIVVLEK